MRFDRITIDPAQMGGAACVRGMRIPVATIVGLIGQGLSVPEVLTEYPSLDAEDVLQSIRFAAAAVEERELPIRHAS